MIRRLLPVGLALVAMASSGRDARAQISPGIHLARAADVAGGTYGAGGSLKLSFPLAPVEVMVAGDYFFPDCTADCSFWGGSADVHFKMPFPVLTPYGAAGVVYRKYSLGGASTDHTGFGVGAGIDLGAVGFGAYAEARYEFVDPDDEFVLRLGIRF
jgi:hypothetical protein